MSDRKEGRESAYLRATGTVVRLGRIKPAARPQALRLATFLDRSLVAANPPPKSVDYLSAAGGIDQMYANDRYGDCVVAGKFHAAGIWSGNDKQVPIVGTDKEVVNQYFAICGPGDNGCVITEVLNVYKGRGLTMGGVARKIDGYVAVDNTDETEVKVAIHIFGGLCIGFNVPSEWMDVGDGGTWDTPISGRFVGGHDVQIIDYNETGVRLSTWGGTRTMTWRAFKNTRIVDECYAMLSPNWYNEDNVSPGGIMVNDLKTALTALAGDGPLPPWEPPVPVPPQPPTPPVPPTPVPHPVVFPAYKGSFRLPILGAIEVNLTPVTSAGDERSLPWLTLLRDCIAIAMDVMAQNWPKLLEDIAILVGHFQQDRASLEATSQRHAINRDAVKWLQLFRDVQKLVADFQANAPIRVLIEDARAIARDLGLDV